MKRFFLYVLRWEASTIILAPCIYFLNQYGSIVSAIVGNFIGACVFYKLDKFIFKKK